MKILWLSHLVPWPTTQGVLLRAHYLLKEVAKHHEVHLLAFNQRDLIEPYFESFEQGMAEAEEVLSALCPRMEFFDCPVDRSRWHKLWCAASSLWRPHPYNINWLEDAAFGRRVKAWHAEEHYDLIHCDTISLVPYVDGIDDTLLALDHHNIESHMLLHRAGLEDTALKRWYYGQEGRRLETYERDNCPRFDVNIVCSELDGERLLDICPGVRIRNIPNGVDTEFFKPSGQPSAGKKLLFLGTMNDYKNVRAMEFFGRDIWPLLQAEDPELVMDVVGKSPPASLQALAAEDPNFRVHGFVHDIKPVLHGATVFVCPMYDSGGTKLKMLDSFASGKAVVAHPVVCEGLGVTDGEHVLLAETPQEFCDAILKLVNDDALRASLERNARALAERDFAFDKIGRELVQEFEALEANRSSAGPGIH